jgi:hypothetical protein
MRAERILRFLFMFRPNRISGATGFFRDLAGQVPACTELALGGVDADQVGRPHEQMVQVLELAAALVARGSVRVVRWPDAGDPYTNLPGSALLALPGCRFRPWTSLCKTV